MIGISTDTIEDQQKFTDKEKLTFPLYADADKKGIVRKIYPMAQAAKHPDEVLDYIKENLAKQ